MTGSFYVDPAALAGLMKLLERLGDDALAGDRYVLNNTGLAGGEGWLNQLSGAHEHVVSYTKEWLRTLRDPVALHLGSAVGTAVRYYQRNDRAGAQRQDATIRPQTGRIDVPEPNSGYLERAGAARFSDIVEPADSYRPPPDYNDDPRFRYQPEFADLVSIASNGRNAIFKATELLAKLGWLDRAYDPYEIVLKPVVGDWAGFRRCADVYRNLAEAVFAMASNLHYAQVKVPEAWRGNAADAGTAFLSWVREGVGNASDPLRAIAAQYESAAKGQAEFRAAVATLISDLIDAAILLLLTVAGTAATAWTGVGAVAGTFLGLAETYVIVKRINMILDWYGRIDAMIQAASSGFYKFGQLQASSYHLPILPVPDDRNSPLLALPR